MVLKDRVLGKTGLRVKVMGFGGIPIQRVSEETAISVVRRCYELGVDYYDTARGYTTSEERIGKALEDVREKVVLATKTPSKTRRDMEDNLATSLRNLRTDYIDVYQLHNVSSHDAWKTIKAPGGALEGMMAAKEEGRILHIGVTSHNPDVLADIVREDVFETAMIPYNYLATEPEKRLLPLCRERGVAVIVMKPFGGGAFTDANVALKYVLANPLADITIPGMLSVEEVEENVRVCQGDLSLSAEELSAIEEDRRRLGDTFCRACDYCQPCPVGIPINFVLRTEHSSLRRMGWSESMLRQTVEAEKKVEECLQCGACETRCPYQLPIRALLPERMESLLKRMKERSIP